MGSRYYVTGVQIGMLMAYLRAEKDDKVREILNKILDNQYIGTKEELNKIPRNRY